MGGMKNIVFDYYRITQKRNHGQHDLIRRYQPIDCGYEFPRPRQDQQGFARPKPQR